MTRLPRKSDDTSTPQPGQSRKTRLRNSELDAALGSRIRAARTAARMSQTALGAALGVSFQQVQKYETGKDRVTVSTLQGIAAVLGVHPGSFFGDDMPVPVGGLPDVKSALRIANRIQRIRNPVVVKRLMALVGSACRGGRRGGCPGRGNAEWQRQRPLTMRRRPQGSHRPLARRNRIEADQLAPVDRVEPAIVQADRHGSSWGPGSRAGSLGLHTTKLVRRFVPKRLQEVRPLELRAVQDQRGRQGFRFS